MEALIAVFLGRIDIIRYAAGFLLESVGEHRVNLQSHGFLAHALGRVVDDFGEVAVFEMVEVVAEFVHFAPDTVGLAVFYSHFGLYAGVGEGLIYLFAEALEAFGLRGLVLLSEAFYLVVFMRAAEAETEILKLGLDMVEAEAVGQRGIEIVGLAGDFHLLVGAHCREGAHVVEAVGELDERWAHVVLHRRQHLPEIIYLQRGVVVFFLLLCHHPYEKSHVVAEALAYLFN